VKPLKISILIDAFTPGGAQKVLLALVPEWISLGHRVQIILIQNANQELDLHPLNSLGVRIEKVSAQSILDFAAFFRILKIAKQFKPEFLQCHLYWSQIWGGILKIAFPKIDLIWVEHNMYLNRTFLQWKLYRFFARFTAEIIAVSVEVSDFLNFHNLKRIRFVPNPISLTFGIKKGIDRENSIAFVGRFNEQKNPMLAIKVFEFALKTFAIPMDSKLKMVGDGPQMSELLAYVGSHGLKDKVLFTGFLEEKNLSELLTKTRVLISTSLHEGCPLVRIEAAASGCTIVTTATGGIKGILSRDVEGLELLDGVFVVESEIFALSSALAKAFSPKLWTFQKIAARSGAMSKFNPELIARAYITS
jgi:glycosyltransferase involved in cell wall biosynthesis